MKITDKLQQLAGRNLGRVFISRSWLHVCKALVLLRSKTAQLKVENSAQITFRFCPDSFRAPRENSTLLSHGQKKGYKSADYSINYFTSEIMVGTVQKAWPMLFKSTLKGPLTKFGGKV
jgi:hypothetical protein